MKHVYIVSFINIINTNTFLLFVAKFVILLIITAATVATAKNIDGDNDDDSNNDNKGNRYNKGRGN